MACVGGREQAMIEVLLAQLRRGLPVQASRRGAVEIFLHGRSRDPNAARYRRIAQPQPHFEPKHLLNPTHRHPRSWHLPAPPKGATVAAITCRSAAMPKPTKGAENAEIGCRIGAKSGAAFRRNHLRPSTEIRCRFAPIFAGWRQTGTGFRSKAAGDFDRNPVPVCSDFCRLEAPMCGNSTRINRSKP